MQPRCSNECAPWAAVGDRPAVTALGSARFDTRSGDHGAAEPRLTSAATLTPNRATTPTAHGRRRGLRSPVEATNGNSTNNRPSTSGKPMMNQSSTDAGISANRAKYHRKYQSGRGYACTTVGSALLPSSGGPSHSASTSTIEPTASANTTSFQPASGQKGSP